MNFNIGEKIKELRASKKLTQAKLAKRLHVSASTISSYEVGDRQPSYDIIVRISRFFNVTTDYLLGVSAQDMVDVSGLSSSQLNIVRELVIEFKNKNAGEQKE